MLHPANMALRLQSTLGCCCTNILRRSIHQLNRRSMDIYVHRNSIFARRLASNSKGSSRPKLTTSAGPISWRSFGVLIIVGGGILLYVRKLKQEKEAAKERERSRSIGKSALGGPFSLTDFNGERKTDKDFLGQWMILYYGFTFCPDICPDELDKLTVVLNSLDEIKKSGLKDSIQPVFITVDPKRDTPAVLKAYLKDFHPRIIGLTGTEEEIYQATRSYRVYYSPSQADEDNDYLVDHTIIMYLVNPEGKFVDYYGQNKTAEEISSSIAHHMLVYQERKK